MTTTQGIPSREFLRIATISQIAYCIQANWPKVSIPARPYMDAMKSMNKITDKYCLEDGSSIVAYFLSNATGWRGEAARFVKAELNLRLRG